MQTREHLLNNKTFAVQKYSLRVWEWKTLEAVQRKVGG